MIDAILGIAEQIPPGAALKIWFPRLPKCTLHLVKKRQTTTILF